MRYPQEGGLTAERQQFREGLRLRAAERFALGEASAAIAKDAGQCPVGAAVAADVERRWSESSAVAGACVITAPESQAGRTAGSGADQGAAAHGWEDQRWTLSRVTTVIGRRCHLTSTVQGVRKLLVRNGWSCQVPVRRAMERDDDAVAGGVKEDPVEGIRSLL